MDAPASSSANHATRREWMGLIILSIACLLYSMDLSVLFLAIPSIVTDLDPSPTELLWINDIYGFMVAGFLVTMGTLGDRIGRRKVLLYGAAAFGAASILCAFASTAPLLIVARALLGIAGATIAPSTLSLIVNMFQREDERARAIGVWGTAFALGGLIGPVLGGVLLNWFHWGSVFLVNVPIMIGLLIAGPMLLPEYKASTAGKVDLVSVLMSLMTALPVIYGLKLIAAYGPSLQAAIAVVIGIVCGNRFLARQRSIEHPMIDLTLFSLPRFNVSLLVNLAGIFFIFAIFMFQNQYFQLVLNLSPLEAGLWSVGPSAVFALMSLYSYKVIDRFGAENAVINGLIVFAIGAAVMCIGAHIHSLFTILGASILMAFGFVPVILTTTNLIVSSAPPERAGSASAISETSAEFGGALGVALLGSLGTVIYRWLMQDTEAPAAAKATLAAAVQNAAAENPAWLEQARNAFASGYAVTCAIAMVGLLLLSAVARRVLGPRPN
jgi:MFS transporter, DHA2 family, multidrug resistance protein